MNNSTNSSGPLVFSLKMTRRIAFYYVVALLACLWTAAWVLCLALTASASASSPAIHSTPSGSPQHTDTALPAKTWAEESAAREIQIILHSGSYIRYRQRTIDTRGDEARDVIESKDGTVARLIMRNNRPLTQEEDNAERDRLIGLIDHPSDFAKHVKNEASNKKMAVDLVKLMPTAMIFSYMPEQAPSSVSSAPQVVLDYTPDPKFNPPTTASEALSGLRGRIWIDTRSKTIVRMTAEIFQPVNLGWGMLAHIYPGGKIDLEQTDALGDRWNMTVFHEHVTVKALMVKTLNVNTEVHSFDFQQVTGELRYQDAIHILLDTPLPR